MAHGRRHGTSRDLAIYALLLQLYPRAYRRRHRAELLQNFQDLEREFASKAALWRFIARDLAVSLRHQLTRTLWGQTAIRFAILSLMLALVHGYPRRDEHAVWTFCCGYALGWFAGWFGRQWRLSSSGGPPAFVRSFGGQAALLVCALTALLAAARLFPDLQERFVFACCYGTALAWFSGWQGNYQHMRL